MQVVLSPSEAEAKWEAKCNPASGCGTVCCFWEGSPCEHLELNETTRIGRCSIYEHRFGTHRTLEGKEFLCAPAALWIQKVSPPDACGYATVLRVNGIPTVRGMVKQGQVV